VWSTDDTIAATLVEGAAGVMVSTARTTCQRRIATWRRCHDPEYNDETAKMATCATCGCQPCINPGFCATCRASDRLARGGRARPSADFTRDWDGMSLHALFAQLNGERRQHGAAQSTYDAVFYELRTYGVAQFAQANCRRRLADLSTTQVRELIAALIHLRPQHATTITDDLIGLLGDQLCPTM